MKGNHFRILLRDVEQGKLKKEVIIEYLARLSPNQNSDIRFVNYFGLQRFGMQRGSNSTHAVGRFVLQQNFEAVINSLVAPMSVEVNHERVEIQRARKLFENGEFRESLELFEVFGSSCHQEKKILRALNSSKGNYFGAFMSLPRPNRLLYLHAWQSYIWNHIATFRIQMNDPNFIPSSLDQLLKSKSKFVAAPLKLLVGDLVLASSSNISTIEGDSSNQNQEKSSSEEEEFELNENLSCDTKIHVITCEDIELNRFSIDDVILPLPGYAVHYPMQNEIRQWYVDFLRMESATWLCGDELMHPWFDADATNSASPSDIRQSRRETALRDAVHQLFGGGEKSDGSRSRSALPFMDALLPGSYRKLVSVARCFQHELVESCSSNQSSSALPVMLGSTLRDFRNGLDVASITSSSSALSSHVLLRPPSSTIEAMSNQEQEEGNLSLALEFSLPTSSYATMLLREVLKTNALENESI